MLSVKMQNKIKSIVENLIQSEPGSSTTKGLGDIRVKTIKSEAVSENGKNLYTMIAYDEAEEELDFEDEIEEDDLESSLRERFERYAPEEAE
jgi:uncharacterized membrane protein YheB (UPF0754 family)